MCKFKIGDIIHYKDENNGEFIFRVHRTTKYQERDWYHLEELWYKTDYVGKWIYNLSPASHSARDIDGYSELINSQLNTDLSKIKSFFGDYVDEI